MPRIRRSCLASMVVLATALAETAPRDRLIDFHMEDQFQQSHTGAEFAGQMVLMLWADRKGHQFVTPWVVAFREAMAPQVALGKVNVRGIGHVKGAPFFIKGRIRRRLSRDPNGWVLLDTEGAFRAAYQLPEDQVSLLLFDREHKLVWCQSVTELDSAVVDSVRLRVERMLQAP